MLCTCGWSTLRTFSGLRELRGLALRCSRATLGWLWDAHCSLPSDVGRGRTLLKTCSEEMWATRFINWRGTNLKTGKYFTMIAQEKQDYQEWD